MTRKKQFKFNFGEFRFIGGGEVDGFSVALVDRRMGLRPLRGELCIFVAAESGLNAEQTVRRGKGVSVLTYGGRDAIQKVFKRKGLSDGNGKDHGTDNDGNDNDGGPGDHQAESGQAEG